MRQAQALIASTTVALLAFCSSAVAAPIDLTVDVNELIKLLFENGFTAPTASLQDTKDHFELLITGGAVNDDITQFSFPFTANFWRGNITMSQADPFTSGDVISVSGDIHHDTRDDGIPHPTDKKEGSTAGFSGTINSSFAGPGMPIRIDRDLTLPLTFPFGDTVPHPLEHSDRYSGFIFAHILAEVGDMNDPDPDNNISTWQFKLEGDHRAAPVPEPATLMLLGSGLVGVGAAVRRRCKGRKVS